MTSPERSTSDAVYKAIRGLRDGTLSTADFFTVCTLEGVMNHAQLGTTTTPVAMLGTGVIATTPQLVVDVDDGYSIIAAAIQVHLEASAGTVNEIVACTSKGTKIGGSSTAVTQLNANTGYSPAIGASAFHTVTAGTTPTTPNEFWRTGYAFADTTVGPVKVFSWSAQGLAPVVKGPGALSLMIGATTTAPTGYAKIAYVVLPSTLLF